MKGRTTKHLVKFAVICFLFFPFIFVGGLNYSGMCLSEFRYLSDGEKIQAAISIVKNLHTIQFKRIDYKNPVRIRFENYPQIKYSDDKDFLKKNPGCCHFNPVEADHFDHPNFISRIFHGFNYDVIQVDYMARYRDINNNQQSQQITRYVYLTNCGMAQINDWR